MDEARPNSLEKRTQRKFLFLPETMDNRSGWPKEHCPSVVQFVHVAAGVCLSGCTCACGWDRFGNSSYISRDRGRKRDETVNENLGEVMLAWGEKS